MKIEAFCHIKASKREVFETFSDLENLANNVTAITNIELLTNGPTGVGTKFKETRLMFGKESTETMEITQFNPFESFREEAHSNGIDYISDWTFSEQNGTTTVSICFTSKANTLMGKLIGLLFSLMAGGMKKAFMTDMEELRNVLESKSNNS